MVHHTKECEKDEELSVSHQERILAKVVHRVLEEYDLTQKVSKQEFYLSYFQS